MKIKLRRLKKVLSGEYTDPQRIVVGAVKLYIVNPDTGARGVLQRIDFGPLPIVIPPQHTVGISLDLLEG